MPATAWIVCVPAGVPAGMVTVAVKTPLASVVAVPSCADGLGRLSQGRFGGAAARHRRVSGSPGPALRRFLPLSP